MALVMNMIRPTLDFKQRSWEENRASLDIIRF